MRALPEYGEEVLLFMLPMRAIPEYGEEVLLFMLPMRAIPEYGEEVLLFMLPPNNHRQRHLWQNHLLSYETHIFLLPTVHLTFVIYLCNTRNYVALSFPS